ncbi:MAG: hypothetical protein SGJ23_03655 [Alphaproteobacteria bacterium]|nr:hypothetical protein [Alphaproteobacteria bacterium]
MTQASDLLGLTRRGQLQAFFGAFTLFALLGEARADTQRIAPARWIDRQDEIARALKTGQITALAWMTEVERLAQEVDAHELMATVNRARITPAQPPETNDPHKRFVRFIDSDGAPRRLAYAAALFDFAPRNIITPHGHKHMVSAHMVVAGRFRIRNFDRIRDAGADAMIIRPTRDYVAGPGSVSTMSSARDNIHWFVPVGGPSTTFDVIISGLDPGEDDYEIRAIDPLGGRRMADGSIIAPVMDFADASRRYTADI